MVVISRKNSFNILKISGKMSPTNYVKLHYSITPPTLQANAMPSPPCVTAVNAITEEVLCQWAMMQVT